MPLTKEQERRVDNALFSISRSNLSLEELEAVALGLQREILKRQHGQDGKIDSTTT